MKLLGPKLRTQPTLLTAIGTWDSLMASFGPCPPMPHSSSGASTQGRALLQSGHCHLLFGKPTSGPSVAKSNFAQELHGWTRKSEIFSNTKCNKEYQSILDKSLSCSYGEAGSGSLPNTIIFAPQKQQWDRRSFLLLTLCCSFPNFSHQ